MCFLFEEGEPALPAAGGAPRGPQYLGEFRVIKADAQGATLQPVLPLDDFERQRLAGSRGPWSMYEVMPTDRYEIFAGLSEDELKKQVPRKASTSICVTAKKRTPMTKTCGRPVSTRTASVCRPISSAAPPKTLYQRRLRDYALEFDQLAKQRAVLATDLEGVNLDIDRLKTSLADAENLQNSREDEIRKLNIDLAGVKKELRAIAAHLKLVSSNWPELSHCWPRPCAAIAKWPGNWPHENRADLRPLTAAPLPWPHARPAGARIGPLIARTRGVWRPF